MSRTIVLRPGFLVSLNTRLIGGVTYNREDVAHERDGAEERTSWNTEKIVTDVDELARAASVRGRIRTLIRSASIITPFGMVCAAENEAALDARITEAEALCAEFNTSAVHTRVQFRTLRGRIAEDTREAIAAVREEIHSLVGELQTALAAGSVETIRDVAQKATQMSRLLEDGTEARTALDRAVKESRRVATELVKRIGEGADAAAEVLAAANVKLIASARMAFEEDETGEITDAVPALPSAAVGRFDTLGEEYVEVPEFTVAEREAFLRLYERTPEEYFGDYRNEEGLEDRVRVDLAGFMRVDAAEAAQSSLGASATDAEPIGALAELMPSIGADAVSAALQAALDMPLTYEIVSEAALAAGLPTPPPTEDRDLLAASYAFVQLQGGRRPPDPQAPADDATPPDLYDEDEIV